MAFQPPESDNQEGARKSLEESQQRREAEDLRLEQMAQEQERRAQQARDAHQNNK